MTHDCVIVGGGIAGLQAAIQLGRYRRDTVVIDANTGRSTLCRNYRNLLGWPDGVSGLHLRRLGRQQAESFGVTFVADKVIEIRTIDAEEAQEDVVFRLKTETGAVFDAKRLLIATGVVDNLPDIEGLERCLGKCVYVCPDCDGYESIDRRTAIIGSGRAGANMALTLTYFEGDLTFIDHATDTLEPSLRSRLDREDVRYIQGNVTQLHATEDAQALQAVVLESGRLVPSDCAFVAFGNNRVLSALASKLGAKTNESGHLMIDARTKMTSVEHVFAAGDVAVHSEQTSIAMGDGAQAAIWMHKSLLHP